MDEDFARLLNEVNEIESEELVDGYITKKTVLKILEELWSKHQYLCKEKDTEIQHWIRKHKQDTKDLQSILEEQERAEVGVFFIFSTGMPRGVILRASVELG